MKDVRQFAGDVPLAEIQDFNRRWLSARLSALRNAKTGRALILDEPVLDRLGSAEPESTPVLEAQYLDEVCAAAGPEKTQVKDDLLRAVFDNSRKLSLGFAKRFGLTFEINDLRSLLELSGIPCARGSWTERENACVLTRNDCGFCRASGSYACDYWREAMDGLVMGLGEHERFVRHASVRHGDAECLDVFFNDTEKNRGDSPAWGPVPEHMAVELFETSAYFQRTTGIPLELKGFREGTLFFEFGASTDPLCGNGGLLSRRFDAMIKEKFPGLAVKDVTPQAVLGTTGA